jgi:hypothetical protein
MALKCRFVLQGARDAAFAWAGDEFLNDASLPVSPASVRLPSFTGAIRDWTFRPETSCCCFSRFGIEHTSFQCFQQLQWLPWDCQTLESTRKAHEPWVIAVGDSEG